MLFSRSLCSIEIGKVFLSVRSAATDTRFTALYGKPYIPAAKDTWNLLRKRGIDALVNDSLVGIVLTTGAYIVGRECRARQQFSSGLELIPVCACSVDGIVRVSLRESTRELILECRLTLSSSFATRHRNTMPRANTPRLSSCLEH